MGDKPDQSSDSFNPSAEHSQSYSPPKSRLRSTCESSGQVAENDSTFGEYDGFIS